MRNARICRRQRAELRAALEVAREEDDAADQRMQEALAVGGAELEAFDAQDDRTARDLLAHLPRRFPHQRLHLPHGLAQSREHGARDDRVPDVQLAHARQRGDRLHVEVRERVTGVEAHAERRGSRRPP